MTRSLKALLLILALAALPLRGLAAVAMWHCPDGQHGAGAASTSQHQHQHEHDGDAPHHASDAAPATEKGDSPQTASTCSACAACCMGGFIAPTAWSLSSFAPIGAVRIPYVEQRFAGFIPAQLERPPLVQPL